MADGRRKRGRISNDQAPAQSREEFEPGIRTDTIYRKPDFLKRCRLTEEAFKRLLRDGLTVMRPTKSQTYIHGADWLDFLSGSREQKNRPAVA